MAQERFLDGPLTDILAQWRHYFTLLAPRASDVIVDVGCDTGDADRLLAADFPEVAQVVDRQVLTPVNAELTALTELRRAVRKV